MLPKYIRNLGKPWTSQEIQALRNLARKNTPTRVIGLILGRTEESIRTKAHEFGMSLKPVNQTPYNRRNK